MRNYTITLTNGSRKYTVTIKAMSINDAEKRIKELSQGNWLIDTVTSK